MPTWRVGGIGADSQDAAAADPLRQQVVAAPDDPRQLVARMVAEGVVDLLEVIEVDQHQCARLPAPAAFQGVLSISPEQLPVG